MRIRTTVSLAVLVVLAGIGGVAYFDAPKPKAAPPPDYISQSVCMHLLATGRYAARCA